MDNSDIVQNLTRIRSLLYRPTEENGQYSALLYTYEFKKLQEKEKQINTLLNELRSDYQTIEYKIKEQQRREKENNEK